MVDASLRATFRPEFLNRVDDIVMFHPLDMSHIDQILVLQLEEVRARLAGRRITLLVEPAASERLALEGYDPVYGARPLKRVIQREIVDRVAMAMAEGLIADGDTVTIDVIDDELGIRSGPRAVVAWRSGSPRGGPRVSRAVPVAARICSHAG
jgi:ATP-dependent Clp protease ATP-binding subunit ClpB